MQISDIFNRITKAKRSQEPLVRYVVANDQVLGLKIRYCGSWLLFREWIESGDCRVLNANFCKTHLLCMSCSVRRAAKMNEAYLPKVESVSRENPGLVPAMVTLTVKNGGDLKERIGHLKKSWSKMLAAKRRGASNSKKNSPVEWNKVLGSIRATEVTMGKDGKWHPHFHIFCLLSDYIDQGKLSREWEHWTGDSKIVGVTRCKGGIHAGLREVLKYSCKFSSMTHAETLHVYRTCKGARFIDPQGVLRGVPEPDIDSDSLEGMTGAYRDFIASWSDGAMKYLINQVPEVTETKKVAEFVQEIGNIQ